ncbi:MAG: transposase [Pseudomonas fragi]|jgi:transposase-like protein
MPPQRRTYSKSFKAQVIQECSEPGASIADVVRETSSQAISKNQIAKFMWY